jgi:Uma2 family endonuclease
MVQAKPRFRNFEEYLTLKTVEGLPETRAEYVDGELIELPPESRINLLIAQYLSDRLKDIGVPDDLIYTHAFEVEVPPIPEAREESRLPDLIVIRPEHLEPTEDRATITLEMLPPQLIAEVVSPKAKNITRDYVAKREQYRLIKVPEYWLIDPIKRVITVLDLDKHGQYAERGVFTGDERLSFSPFGELLVTVGQILDRTPKPRRSP